jgi:diguanylate cyclase (GGDEF)-like protein
LLFPQVRVAYRNPDLHLVLNAVEAMIGLLAAYLLFGRFRERGLARDVLLVASLLVFSFTNLVLASLPHEIRESHTPVLAWGPLLLRLTAGGLLAVAAWVTARPAKGSWTFPQLVTWTICGIAVVFAALAGVGESLPHVFETADFVGGDFFAAHGVVIAAQAVLAILFGVASVGLTRSARESGDELHVWVGAGAALAATARINYIFFPSLYSDYVYTGDVLRLAWYLMLLIGASSEIRAYWTRLETTVEERTRLADELRRLALVDELTGLRNRRGLTVASEPILSLAARGETSPALLFIDLNDLKTINDRFGHDAGDEAIKEVATVLQDALREADVVARLGGDEFCALLHPDSDADRVVDRIQQKVRDRAGVATEPWSVSLAIGLATYDPARHKTLEDLIQDADAAMYSSKRALKKQAAR